MDQPQVANPATQSTSNKKKLLTPSTAVALVIVVIAVLFTPNLKEFFAAKKSLEQPTVQVVSGEQATNPTSDELLLLREQKLLQQQQDVLAEYANLSIKVQELQVSLDELQQLVQTRSAAFEAAK